MAPLEIFLTILAAAFAATTGIGLGAALHYRREAQHQTDRAEMHRLAAEGGPVVVSLDASLSDEAFDDLRHRFLAAHERARGLPVELLRDVEAADMRLLKDPNGGQA